MTLDSDDLLGTARSLSDSAERQWRSLDVIIDDMLEITGSDPNAVRAALEGLGLGALRPMRVDRGDGTGRVVRDLNDRGDDPIVAYLLASSDARRHADPDLARVADFTVVAWTIPSLVAWLERVGMGSLVPEAWSSWMEDERPRLAAAGLLVEPVPMLAQQAEATSAPTSTSSPGLRSADDLRTWLGARRDADVEKHLRRSGIEFTRGVGGRPVTTDEAINAALCVNDAGEAKAFDFGG